MMVIEEYSHTTLDAEHDLIYHIKDPSEIKDSKKKYS